MNIFTRKDTNGMNDDDRRKMAVELANSYLRIMPSFAWKDLDEYLDKLSQDSVKACEECDMRDLTVAAIGHLRGVRETIRKIRKHVDFAVNGGPKQ